MKLPALYLKTWKRNEIEPDMPKFGLDWWVVSGKSKDRRGVDLITPWGKVDLTYTSNVVKYEKDIENEFRGLRIL
jgi:hypothetical protein